MPNLRKILKPIHPFPARMAPDLVWDFLKRRNNKHSIVLDPMAGSGTVLAVAKKLGHRAFGFDTDPLAVLLSSAWCSYFEKVTFSEIVLNVYRDASNAWGDIAPEDAYPPNPDAEIKNFVNYWFDEKSKKQLKALSNIISNVNDEIIKRLLWCSFSRLIITKQNGVSLAMDVSHSRPHRVYDRAPLLPLDGFIKAAKIVAENSPFADCPNAPPETSVCLGDARFIPLRDSCIDFVVTSPPYLNAIDYLRGHKFALIWMGHKLSSLRRIRSKNIGSEVSSHNYPENAIIDHVISTISDKRSISVREKGLLTRYINDLVFLISGASRVLKPGGEALFVIGNSTRRGVFFRNSVALTLIAQAYGLKIESIKKRRLPAKHRYLPPPSSKLPNSNLQRRIREEILIRAVKPN